MAVTLSRQSVVEPSIDDERAHCMAMTDVEQEAREKLALCGRALNREGLYDVAGHISLRIPNSDLILITPGGGLDKARLRPSDLTVIDATGKRVAGPFPPPLETPIHTVAHAARPELDSIAHLHAHWSTVFSVSRVPLEPVIFSMAAMGPPPPAFDHPGLVTTQELGEQLRDSLGQAAAILMRWHGITVVGDTLEEMFDRALAMEMNARILWEARALGPESLLTLEPANLAIGRSVSNAERSNRTYNYYANLERETDEQHQEGRSAKQH
jgi:ribulose-5-phosphate 4-epimerase/fuculose-1-phosphate aldolase